MGYDRTIPEGEVVEIVRQNDAVVLDGDLVDVMRMRNWNGSHFKLGDEVHLVAINQAEALAPKCKCGARLHSDYYDSSDNTHRVWSTEFHDYSWIHEGALEIVDPPSQEDEDAAIASILRSAAPRHLPLSEDGYRANAEDCPACVPNLHKMAYPYICPGPETT